MLSGLGKNIPEVPLIKRSSAVVTESKIQKQVNSEENILADALFFKKNSGAEHTQNDAPSIEFEEA